MYMNATFRPSEHLKHSAASDNPIITIWGDSIARPLPTVTHDESESFDGLFRTAFSSANPDVTPTFFTRAIGAARIDHANDATLNATGLTLPTWPDNPTYDPATDSWPDVVVSTAPTTLIWHFGMNDGVVSSDLPIFHEAKFQAVVTEMQTRLPNCDFVFVINMVPNFYSSNASLAGVAAQAGRLFVAERIRQFCLANGYGIIDIGAHQCRMLKEGFDPTVIYRTKDVDTGTGSTPYTIAESELDFGIKWTMTASAALWTSRMKLTTSMQGPNAGSWIEIYDNGGFVAVDVVVLDTVPARVTITSTVATPTTGSAAFEAFLTGNTLRVELGGAVVADTQIERHGGTFSPVLSFLDLRQQAMTAVDTFKGRYARGTGTMTFAEMFGSESVVDGVTGGNDQNHLTSEGWAKIYKAALNAISLRLEREYINGGIIRSRGTVPAMDIDSIYSITPPTSDGFLMLTSDNDGVSAMVHYNCGSTPQIDNRPTASPAYPLTVTTYPGIGWQTELVTPGTNLTGTTGTSGKFSISIKNGSIQLENRRPSILGTVRYTWIANAS